MQRFWPQCTIETEVRQRKRMTEIKMRIQTKGEILWPMIGYHNMR